jgi:hypothetical protein
MRRRGEGGGERRGERREERGERGKNEREGSG